MEQKYQIALGIAAFIIIVLGASLYAQKRHDKGGWDRKDFGKGPGMMDGQRPPEGMMKQEDAAKVTIPTIDLKAPEGAGAVEDGAYTVLGPESKMVWVATKPLLNNYVDDGIVGISEGSLSVSGGKSTVGNVVIDFNTIGVASTGKGSGESMLVNKLKGKDFFDVATYPVGNFTLKEATPAADVATSHAYTLKGDLTVKGKTNPVEMQAVAYSKDGLLHVVATTQLDRTLWDIRFGSDKFFDNLANNVIADLFTVTFDLVAKKQ